MPGTPPSTSPVSSNPSPDSRGCQRSIQCDFGIRLDRRLAGSLRSPAAVETLSAMLEGGHHAAYRLVEQQLDDALQDPRLEIEIDKEIDPATARHRVEDPMVVEVAERA